MGKLKLCRYFRVRLIVRLPETLSNDNGVAIRLGPNDTGTIVDSVAWGKAQNIFAHK